MAALDDLISQIPDESLRERIRAEVKRANRQKKSVWYLKSICRRPHRFTISR